MAFDRANLPTDIATLHQIILAQAAEAEAREAELAAAKAGLMAKVLEIEKYKLQIARLRRMQFGRSSEKIARTIKQLELRLEELEAETPAATGDASASDSEQSSPVEPSSPQARKQSNRRRCPLIFRVATLCTRRTASARPAAAIYARWERTSPGFFDYTPGYFEVVRHARPAFSRSRADAARAWCRARCRHCRSSAANPERGCWRTFIAVAVRFARRTSRRFTPELL
jgi:transposase